MLNNQSRCDHATGSTFTLEGKMSGYGDAIGNAVMGMIQMVAVAAFAAGALSVWLLPKLWHLVKPIIHSVTT